MCIRDRTETEDKTETEDNNVSQEPRYDGDLYAYAKAVTNYFTSLTTKQEQAEYLGLASNKTWFRNEDFRAKLLTDLGGQWPAVESQISVDDLTIDPQGLYFNIYVAPSSGYAPVIYANRNQSDKSNKWEALLIYVEKDDSWYEREKPTTVAGLNSKAWDAFQEEIIADPSWHKVGAEEIVPMAFLMLAEPEAPAAAVPQLEEAAEEVAVEKEEAAEEEQAETAVTVEEIVSEEAGESEEARIPEEERVVADGETPAAAGTVEEAAPAAKEEIPAVDNDAEINGDNDADNDTAETSANEIIQSAERETEAE